ncbi:MAG: hypothetical protein KAQ69_08160 [Spirochaetales bacterium]|nr:hypothetical protein [Spirochaetales bacterium]
MFNHGYSIFDRGFMGFGTLSPSIMSLGGIIIMLVIVVLIGLVIYFAVTRGRTHTYHRYEDMYSSENPVTIAKTRFAKGEITKEELDDILKRLK